MVPFYISDRRNGAILYKRLSIFYLQLNYSLSVALKCPPLPLSNIFTQTPQVIYHRKKKIKAACQPVSTAGALLIRNTSTRRQAATSSVFICSADYAVTSKWSVSETSSQATKGSGFTSKSSLEFGEDVKKTFGFE